MDWPSFWCGWVAALSACALSPPAFLQKREGDEKGTAFPKRAAGGHRSHAAGERE